MVSEPPTSSSPVIAPILHTSAPTPGSYLARPLVAVSLAEAVLCGMGILTCRVPVMHEER